MAQKDVDMKDAAEEDHQKEGDKQKEPDEQQAKKDKDLLAFEGKPQLFESHPNCYVQSRTLNYYMDWKPPRNVIQ